MSILKVLLFILLLSSCGKTFQDLKTIDLSLIQFSEEFFVPDYDHKIDSSSFAQVDMTEMRTKVLAHQSAPTLVQTIMSQEGVVTLEDGTEAPLGHAERNPCPATLSNCYESNSEKLGIGPKSLIIPLSEARKMVANQYERGTCVAFSLATALEIHYSHKNQKESPAPQDIYYMAKRFSNTWELAGLSPIRSMSLLAGLKLGLTQENFWPYNKDHKKCDRYRSQYPNAICSETEAQGGGPHNVDRDPQAQAHQIYVIDKAHQLFASMGRIKKALYQGYPVLITVHGNSDFIIARSKQGVIPWAVRDQRCDSEVCAHTLIAIGYEDHSEVEGGGYFVFLNSWGSSWGDQGIGYATYRWTQNSLLDAQALVHSTKNQ